MMTQQIETCR